MRASWGIAMPLPAPIGKGECRSQVIEKVAAGDGFGAEGDNVGGGLLAVHQSESPCVKLAHERDQRHF